MTGRDDGAAAVMALRTVQIEGGAGLVDRALERFECLGALCAELGFGRSRLTPARFRKRQHDARHCAVDVLASARRYALAQKMLTG